MKNDSYSISADKSKLNTGIICKYLSEDSYWAKGRSREVILKSIEGSLCFGVYSGTDQVGFARIVSDYATFAYIADVFIMPEHRGKGLSKRLLTYMTEYPQLQNLSSWLLLTEDAHGLYEQFGFERTERAQWIMEKRIKKP
ncbi:MAG: GNAT family N-acetyltransferase [Bacteroidota bacterium]